MTLLTSRRSRTVCAIATTLAAGSLTFAACTPDSSGNQSEASGPTRVATAMGTRTTEASTSAAESITTYHTASRQTTLTARAFMDYLNEEQRARVLQEGLDLQKLTRAQQVTVFKVLESMLNEDTYQMVASLLKHITTTPDVEPHYLRFSAAPSTDEQWQLDLSGPILGLNALLTEDEEVIFESAHFTLSNADIKTIAKDADAEAVQSPLNRVQASAEELFSSLTPAQHSALADASTTGLKGSELSPAQRQILINITTNWIYLGDEPTMKSKQSKIVDTLDETYFSLASTPDEDGRENLRFQVKGPEIFIEFNETPTANGHTTIKSFFQDPTLVPVKDPDMVTAAPAAREMHIPAVPDPRAVASPVAPRSQTPRNSAPKPIVPPVPPAPQPPAPPVPRGPEAQAPGSVPSAPQGVNRGRQEGHHPAEHQAVAGVETPGSNGKQPHHAGITGPPEHSQKDHGRSQGERGTPPVFSEGKQGGRDEAQGK